jgi:hypothetical protein
MDSVITAAGRALAVGDPLNALNFIALRDDAPALALRGIAMAQLGDLVRAKALIKRAARAFSPREAVARARCVIAAAEIALVSRDLSWPPKPLDHAREVLDRHGDRANAAHARYLTIRRLLLIGRLDEAERLIENFDPDMLPPASQASYHLVVGGIAIRRLRIVAAREALKLAREAARKARIPSLKAEVASMARILDEPAGRLIERGQTRTLMLDEVEALLASQTIVIDACRHVISRDGQTMSLGSRPVLFALARALGEAFPGDVSRAALLERAFRAKHADESHRARLRVEIGRLRKALHGIAGVDATSDGFRLVPDWGRDIVVIAPLADEAHGTILALLADGEAWSSSALALATGESQRTVQRALDDLADKGKVQAVGSGRARRWMAPPLPGFPSTLLLPPALPGS